MSPEKTVSEAAKYRRSVRVYDNEKPLDPQVIKNCIKDAVLAPNSSNMQLYEFYHITDINIKKKLVKYCLSQPAARTADQLIVVVTRKDLWRKRAKANLAHIDTVFGERLRKKIPKQVKQIKDYYGKLMPVTYFDFLGIFGWIKYTVAWIVGLFRPIYRELRAKDMHTVVHKSAGLAAQTFMLGMAAKGYDTCPMEGIDTYRIKRLLKLPWGADINMVISCGIRKPAGVYGERFRVPFEEVYYRI